MIFKKAYDALVDDGIFYLVVREGDGEKVEVDERGYQKIEKFFHLYTKEEIFERAQKAGFTVEKIETVVRSHEWLNIILRKKETK